MMPCLLGRRWSGAFGPDATGAVMGETGRSIGVMPSRSCFIAPWSTSGVDGCDGLARVGPEAAEKLVREDVGAEVGVDVEWRPLALTWGDCMGMVFAVPNAGERAFVVFGVVE